MKEEYLHYAFEKKLFGNQFLTHLNKPLEIIEFGELNQNAGPDFLDAKISYDGQIWVGPIEFHVNASDWYKHKHQYDPAYNNVLAHFVFNNDAEVKLNEFVLPTVELKEQIDRKHFLKYQNLIKAKSAILCYQSLKTVEHQIIDIQKEKSIDRRLWYKSVQIIRDIEVYAGDRKKAYLLALARTFGGRVNQLPFEQLTDRINLSWLRKLNGEAKRIEALFLGLSGLLPIESENVYISELIREYHYAKNLFGIENVSSLGWKYSRMRPSNFPDIRVAQFASLFRGNNQMPDLFSEDWTAESFKSSLNMTLHPYWNTHFRISSEPTKSKNPGLSNNLMDLILINAVSPFLYAIGLLEGNEAFKSKSTDLLKQIKPEKNAIIEEWKNAGVLVKTAFDSQSLLELKKQGCNRKKCLFCAIGKSILHR